MKRIGDYVRPDWLKSTGMTQVIVVVELRGGTCYTQVRREQDCPEPEEPEDLLPANETSPILFIR